jgi:hypothetical protein
MNDGRFWHFCLQILNVVVDVFFYLTASIELHYIESIHLRKSVFHTFFPSSDTSFLSSTTSSFFQYVLFSTLVEHSGLDTTTTTTTLRPRKRRKKGNSFILYTSTTSYQTSNLPLQQPPKEIKTIAITLQLPFPACRSILPTQFLSNK